MKLTLITAATDSVVDLATVKTMCRIDGTEQDAILQMHLNAVTSQCEHILGRSLKPQTWQLAMDSFPCVIKLGMPPIIEVVSIQYLDTDGNLQTLDPADYRLNIDCCPATIRPAVGKHWPNTLCECGAVKVQYRAGYQSDVPASIEAWLMTAVKYMNDTCPDGAGSSKLPTDFNSGLLDRYRTYYC